MLGVPNLVPSHESTSSCRFRYLKFIKLITSGPDHAIRYECGHDVHMTYWVSGSNLLRGIQLDEAPTVVFSISNIKNENSPFSHSPPRLSISHTPCPLIIFFLPLSFGPASLALTVLTLSLELQNVRCCRTTHVMVWLPQTVCVMACGRVCGSPSTFLKLTTCAHNSHLFKLIQSPINFPYGINFSLH